MFYQIDQIFPSGGSRIIKLSVKDKFPIIFHIPDCPIKQLTIRFIRIDSSASVRKFPRPHFSWGQYSFFTDWHRIKFIPSSIDHLLGGGGNPCPFPFIVILIDQRISSLIFQFKEIMITVIQRAGCIQQYLCPSGQSRPFGRHSQISGTSFLFQMDGSLLKFSYNIIHTFVICITRGRQFFITQIYIQSFIRKQRYRSPLLDQHPIKIGTKKTGLRFIILNLIVGQLRTLIHIRYKCRSFTNTAIQISPTVFIQHFGRTILTILIRLTWNGSGPVAIKQIIGGKVEATTHFIADLPIGIQTGIHFPQPLFCRTSFSEDGIQLIQVVEILIDIQKTVARGQSP